MNAEKSPTFATLYPNIAYWIEAQGWIEIGQDDYSQSLLRCLDTGGMVWESDEETTIDEAFQALEMELEKLLGEFE